LSISLQQVAILIWGRNYIPFPDLLNADTVIMGASITKLQIMIVVLCLVLMIGLLVVVEKTKLGRAMRATSQNRPWPA
jgi:branched-chain amino acid transport system permease protein